MPTPLVVGLGEACEIAKREMEYDSQYIRNLSDKLIHSIVSRVPNVIRNGDTENTYPGCVNLSFAFVEGKKCFKRMAVLDLRYKKIMKVCFQNSCF